VLGLVLLFSLDLDLSQVLNKTRMRWGPGIVWLATCFSFLFLPLWS
jgi:hypothetical protein